MAPRPPVSREDFLRWVRSPTVRLPLLVGSPHHRLAVCHEAGIWRLRRLVVDQPRCDALREAQLSNGRPFMAEHVESCLVPGEEIVLEAPSLDEFCRLVETGRWPPW